MSRYDQFLKTTLTQVLELDPLFSDGHCLLEIALAFQATVFNDGTRRNLLQLDGTVPVNYRGVIYNMPVSIWLMHQHPYNPPVVYVKPTSTMQIRSGRYVDMNGKVDLPYIREWKYPMSDLIGLIQILVIVFGEEPPVYSNTASQKTHDVRTHNPKSNDSDVYNECTGMVTRVTTEGSDRSPIPTTEQDCDVKCDVCHADGIFREAEAFCANCEEYFCGECLKYHRRMTATKSHKLFIRD